MSEQKNYIPSTSRIEAFSDGVVAIIVTLLILEIKVPELRVLSNGAVLKALVPLIPKFVGFTVSFVTVAIFWVNHHHFYHSLEYSDEALLWHNNHLLFWLAVIPFVTAFVGDYPTQSIVVALYGFVLMMSATSFVLMVRHVFFKSTLLPETVPESTRQKEFHRGLVGVFLYAMSVVLAFLSPYISLFIFVFIPLYYFFPKKLI